MINFLAEKAFAFVIVNTSMEKLEDGAKQVYRYGIELMIASCINFLCIICVGAVVGRLPESLIFLFCFATLRQFTGGYHANTYIWCNTVFALSFLGVLYLSTATCGIITIPAAAFTLSMSTIPIVLLCPVEHPNKPIDAVQNIIRCKRLAILLWAVFSATDILMISAVPIYGVFLFYTLLLVDVLVVIGKINRREGTFEKWIFQI